MMSRTIRERGLVQNVMMVLMGQLQGGRGSRYPTSLRVVLYKCFQITLQGFNNFQWVNDLIDGNQVP